MKITHRPKGSMCMNCRFDVEYTHCHDLSFHTMRPIGQDPDGTIVVKCDGFERKKDSQQ